MNEDPGWQFSWNNLVPFTLQFDMRSNNLDALLILRRVFITYCVTLLLFGVVVVFVADKSTESAEVAWLIAVFLWGLGSLVVIRIVDRPLDCSSEVALATSYRKRFFVRVAIAESVALLGFVASYAGGIWWTYYVGMVFAFVGLAQAAPSVRAIAEDQRRLANGGCPYPLVATLRTVSPPRK